MAVKETFAIKLKELREEKGMSQGDVAQALGVSRGSISFYENAERTADIQFLCDVAKFFDVSIDYLTGKSNAKSTNVDIKVICDYLGLSDDAAEMLRIYRSNDIFFNMTKLINYLLEQERGIIVRDILDYDDASKINVNNHYYPILSKLYEYLYSKGESGNFKIKLGGRIADTDIENEDGWLSKTLSLISKSEIVSKVLLDRLVDEIKAAKLDNIPFEKDDFDDLADVGFENDNEGDTSGNDN